LVIERGSIWWAELPAPTSAGPGYRRPVIVVQSDYFSRSRLNTIVVIPLTSNLRLAEAPGCLLLSAALTGLSRDSVANVAQIITLDKSLLTERIGALRLSYLQQLEDLLRLVLDL
jgi:mRNA interferase MazF